ncbi:hypothetical protein EVG20_g6293 [Dentipellis fragilis]|uniref:Uncharacterized protein n=1 Tax=Dentipellis fragilis TaxID=205917 RepID=A0A4Y9YMY7_9AGAM|nr:hypothetical protein EVG20_g6293 [Dentipellis fragilis]
MLSCHIQHVLQSSAPRSAVAAVYSCSQTQFQRPRGANIAQAFSGQRTPLDADVIAYRKRPGPRCMRATGKRGLLEVHPDEPP